MPLRWSLELLSPTGSIHVLLRWSYRKAPPISSKSPNFRKASGLKMHRSTSLTMGALRGVQVEDRLPFPGVPSAAGRADACPGDKVSAGPKRTECSAGKEELVFRFFEDGARVAERRAGGSTMILGERRPQL